MEPGDEGYVSFRALTLGEVAGTRLGLYRSGMKSSDAEIFRKMNAAAGENARAGSKTPEIWKKALLMCMNSATKPGPLGGPSGR